MLFCDDMDVYVYVFVYIYTYVYTHTYKTYVYVHTCIPLLNKSYSLEIIPLHQCGSLKYSLVKHNYYEF